MKLQSAEGAEVNVGNNNGDWWKGAQVRVRSNANWLFEGFVIYITMIPSLVLQSTSQAKGNEMWEFSNSISISARDRDLNPLKSFLRALSRFTQEKHRDSRTHHTVDWPNCMWDKTSDTFPHAFTVSCFVCIKQRILSWNSDVAKRWHFVSRVSLDSSSHARHALITSNMIISKLRHFILWDSSSLLYALYPDTQSGNSTSAISSWGGGETWVGSPDALRAANWRGERRRGQKSRFSTALSWSHTHAKGYLDAEKSGSPLQ